MDSSLRLKHPEAPGWTRGRHRWPFWLALLFASVGNNASTVAGIEQGEPKPARIIATSEISEVKPAPAPAEQPADDVLVLKSLEVTHGKLLSASTSGALRWKPVVGKEFEMQAEHVAGIRLAAGMRAEHKPEENFALVELRNGDLLRGEIATFDLKQIVLKHPQLGAVAVERSRILHFYPNKERDVIRGGIEGLIPLKTMPDRRSLAYPGVGEPITWVYLDGTYSQKAEAVRLHPNGGNVLHWKVPGNLDQFEVRFDVAMNGTGQPPFTFMLRGDASDPAVQIALSYPNVQIMNQVANNVRGNQRRFWKAISLKNKVPAVGSRMSIRILVNDTLGTVEVFINGVLAFKLGEQANERLPGLGNEMVLGAYPSGGSPILFSNVWIGSWNGERPKPESAPCTTFSNNDVTAGTVSGFADGKFSIESEIGMLQLPRENLKVIDFGGAMSPEQAKGKIRLADGSAISVESFKWNDGVLTAHSAILGDLRLPAEAVAELIYNPAPAQSQPALKAPRPARGQRALPEITF